MKNLGIAIASVGVVILAYLSLVGIETGIDGFRATNLAGLFVGSAMLICGSTVASAGVIVETLEHLKEGSKVIVTEQKTKTISSNERTRAALRSSPAKKPKNAGEQILVENYNGVPIYQRYNGHFVSDKWFAGIKQARSFIDSLEDAQ